MSKLASYMGFARKSKNLVTGTDTCIKHMEKGKVKLLIIAGDTSDNTMKKLIGKAEKNEVRYRIYRTGDILSKMTGTCGKIAFAVIDEHFADIIVKEIDSDKPIEKEVF